MPISPEISSAKPIKRLLDNVISANRAQILELDETHEVRKQNEKIEKVSFQTKTDGWSLEIDGYPRRKPFVDGVERYEFMGSAKTFFMSPQQTREVQMTIYSEDLKSYEIERAYEIRTANLDGGVLYRRTFLKQMHINPDPKYSSFEEAEEVVVPYKGDPLTLSVFDPKEQYKQMKIDSLMYFKNEEGMWVKTYGVLKGGEFFAAEAIEEFTEPINESDLETGNGPQEMYYKDVPVVADDLKKLNEILEKGRKTVGPRDTELDKMVFVKRS